MAADVLAPLVGESLIDCLVRRRRSRRRIGHPADTCTDHAKPLNDGVGDLIGSRLDRRARHFDHGSELQLGDRVRVSGQGGTEPVQRVQVNLKQFAHAAEFTGTARFYYALTLRRLAVARLGVDEATTSARNFPV